ncbi:MAG: hypothetical protein MJZ00_07300 [Paludibacteraceae bacterium]|nr:hypothetical protein [Paludibacteraceae bacterium]
MNIITEKIWEENKHDIINVSAALSYKKIGPRFEDTWNLFFIPLFGPDVCGLLEQSDKPEILNPARRALAHLTFWNFFDEMNVRITDQGFQRQESDTLKGVFKYQSDNLKQAYKNAGFNALELLLTRLDTLCADNEMWQKAPCCQYRKKHIVQSMAEVDAVYDIHRSYIIYLALRQDIEMMERIKAPAILGKKLFDQLMENIANGEENIGDTTTKELRLRLSAVIVLMSVKRYIERTGTITDRGFYYVNYKPETGNNEQITNVSANNKAIAVAQIEQDINSLTAALNWFIDNNLSELRESDYSHTVRRDNNGKHTFFA